jgi:hypothetical protein
MLQNGRFGAEFDLGRGKFSASVAPGQLFLAPPFTATENAFNGGATGTVMALQHRQVAELLHDMPQQPHALLQDLYTRTFYDDFIRVAINQLVASTRSCRDADRLFADGVIVAIFAALVRHCTRRSPCAGRGLADWQMRRVMEQLHSMHASFARTAGLRRRGFVAQRRFDKARAPTRGFPQEQFARSKTGNVRVSMDGGAAGATTCSSSACGGHGDPHRARRRNAGCRLLQFAGSCAGGLIRRTTLKNPKTLSNCGKPPLFNYFLHARMFVENVTLQRKLSC